ncbi:MAG: hypothetical protein AAFV53_03675 [Myxococcota bacterium]
MSMILMGLLWSAEAAALEGITGQWLPGASPVAQGQGWVSAGGAWDWPGGQGEGVLVRGVVGIGAKTALNAEGHLSLTDPFTDLNLGLRTIVLRNAGVQLAPFIHLGFGGDGLDGTAGLAGQLNGDAITADASIGLIGFTANDGDTGGTFTLPPEAMRVFEGGVAFAPAKRQELRLGLLSRDQAWFTVGYRWKGPWWLISGDLLFWPGDLGARAMAGVRF